MGPLLGSQEHHVQKCLTPGTAGDDVYVQLPHCLGLYLGVAAAYAHNGLGVLPTAAADDAPVFLICNGGDGAGINNVAVTGLIKGAQAMAQGQELLFHGLGFVLVHFAAQCVKCEFHVNITKNLQNLQKTFAYTAN